MIVPRYKTIAENYMDNIEITLMREELTPIYGTNIPKDHRVSRSDYMAPVLFNVLLQVTKGATNTVTRTTVGDNGFDTLRLSQPPFGRTKRQTIISTLMRIVMQKYDEAKFIEQLAKWEFDISECGRVTSERPPEMLTTTLLVTKTTGPMYRHLCMPIVGLTT